jgi:AraC-like DNA-binding protein
MPSSKLSEHEHEPLIPLLQSQVIPCWEKFGADRLTVTAKSFKQFKLQSPPDQIRITKKKRRSEKVTSRNQRTFNNTSTFVATWPEDNQAIFRYPALAYISEGIADFHVADYVIHCPQNHFIYFASGVPRPIGSRPHFEGGDFHQRHCSVMWFFAPPGTGSITTYQCHSQGKKHGGDGYRIIHRTEVVHLYKLLLTEIEESHGDPANFIDSSVLLFLRFLLREFKEGNFHREGKITPSDIHGNAGSPIEEAQQYIKTHLKLPLTAAHVAEQVYMSRNNFLRHFSRATGHSFHEYVTQQRMDEAGRLLHEGRWSIQYICRFTGLGPTQFRAQFKKRYEMNPSEYPGKKVRNR